MPRLNPKRAYSRAVGLKRRCDETCSDESEMSTDEEPLDMEINESDDYEPLNFNNKMIITDIADVFELCKSKCPSKYLSVLLFMTMRQMGITWRECNTYLKSIGAFSSETSHKWTESFVFGDYNEFCHEYGGGKRGECFYDCFPKIETDAKQYIVDRCSEKSADFTANDLAVFIDKKFYEITQTAKSGSSGLIRSVPSCRLDLRKWGARFENNSQRPYFEGHERLDVVEHRSQFIDYFLQRKDYYYTISDSENPAWQIPKLSPPCILLFHDESTFRSGDVSAKRCFFGNEAPFHSKGRGRSNMVSDFLVQHPSGPFFSLTENEYKKATQRYPQLQTPSDLNYYDRSATASIHIGQNSYFDNETILNQFERLFQLLQFKEQFKDHDIEIIVDNARTHSAKSHSLLDFGKSIGTRCPIDTIDYIDSRGVKQILDCYFQSGSNVGSSKGLFEISKELNIAVPDKVKLHDLRNILADHPAFKITSKLEQLADKYNVRIKFCPKFHCELNAIEGLWCHEKQYIRQKSDQTYATMLKLMVESRINFSDRQIHLKLLRRFWRSLKAYKKRADLCSSSTAIF
ncbi:unnamed protein product [Rotaria magnacalcarata]|uniref:Uncharacterized protein n=2 Tax=Rotaria magnacalcarata TaxID=392030 RepID=A0A816NHT6_9BILA|nr:unnamed protein product [Rotaria magnacalcarata]